MAFQNDIFNSFLVITSTDLKKCGFEKDEFKVLSVILCLTKNFGFLHLISYSEASDSMA